MVLITGASSGIGTRKEHIKSYNKILLTYSPVINNKCKRIVFFVGEALAHEFYASGCRVVLAARRAGLTCLR